MHDLDFNRAVQSIAKGNTCDGGDQEILPQMDLKKRPQSATTLPNFRM